MRATSRASERLGAWAMLLAALAAAGCGPTRGPAAAPPPSVTPHQLLAEHNAWADAVEHIWSRADLRVNFPTGETGEKREHYDLDGHLFLHKPDGFFVHGQVLGKEVFHLGMNGERFWLWVGPKVNTVWVGRRGGAGEARLILAPSALMAALGLARIDPSPEQEMRLEEFGPHAVLTEYAPRSGRLLRRTWFSRRTLRPDRIDLYGPGGRRTLMAELLKYERVGETPVCTVYRARFYGDEEVDLVVRLRDVRLDKTPPAKAFEYRRPPGAAEEDLDRPMPEPRA